MINKLFIKKIYSKNIKKKKVKKSSKMKNEGEMETRKVSRPCPCSTLLTSQPPTSTKVIKLFPKGYFRTFIFFYCLCLADYLAEKGKFINKQEE